MLIVLAHHRMKERVSDWFTWIIALLATLFLLFLLSAPPIMNAIVQADVRAGRGCCHFPAIYQPFMSITQSDYGGPLLWYFNDVWHSEIMLIGEENGSPVHMVLIYAVISLALLATTALPFWRRRVWRHRRND
jgi:hypothetical protein